MKQILLPVCSSRRSNLEPEIPNTGGSDASCGIVTTKYHDLPITAANCRFSIDFNLLHLRPFPSLDLGLSVVRVRHGPFDHSGLHKPENAASLTVVCCSSALHLCMLWSGSSVFKLLGGRMIGPPNLLGQGSRIFIVPPSSDIGSGLPNETTSLLNRDSLPQHTQHPTGKSLVDPGISTGPGLQPCTHTSKV
ncbi:hypothetical protein N658DRAFT_307576 [Parathielavia hyrcaniae]|uniref:Uncharacterized protein n=1 Tax=Parathielavia hyrcaniae TaxID=113614 RepID=A0AAN6Q483_9PEZI|nr:hypothetical protein N658DRAFT_307576 [Parathielavia hyrcaniae]